MNNSKLTNQQKAAAVIVSLGVDKASKIYKYLSEDDLEQLTIAIAKLGYVSVEDTEMVLDDFYKMCLTQKVVTEGGMDYARDVLEKAFDESTAHALLEKVSKGMKVKSFDFLRRTDIKSLFSVLQHERPQIIAIVLSYIDSSKAASVISALSEDKRVAVVEKIAKMDSASPEAIKIVEAQMKNKFSTVMTTDFAKIGGIDYIAEVMNNMDRSNEKYIFDEMGKKDLELTETIKKKMFVFEDIASMDGRAIQIFVRECDIKDLVLAIKGTNESVANLIFANMSARMAENIKDELEITTNVRLKEVEEAQQKIVSVIRKLDEEGAIVLSKGGKDDIIV
ncbi:flagellar motor switch protein FliG [Proteocatella sphenisci]|uniref:flagellar motor switch protein FliG n=1 Tax=Proteocatella sphenisci TaxID=181070 RepID=UPI0004AEA369|nr:flagellar motor switch protein FliG [Proteocatella sphenisci]